MSRAWLACLFAVAVAGCGDEGPPLEPMEVGALRAVGEQQVRAVTVEGGCRSPEQARVTEEPGAWRIAVFGRNPLDGQGCTADLKFRCVEFELPQPLGARAPRAANAVADRGYRVRATRHLSGDCRRIPARPPAAAGSP